MYQEVYVIGPKAIVERGYDQIAEIYAAWTLHSRVEERERYTAALLGRLAAGASVLELGCGLGMPTTARLAQQFYVTGVDISARHIALARERIPGANFIHADMTTLSFPEDYFDAVAAFYSLIHVPRDEQGPLLKAIASWLRPGGLLFASMGAHADAGSLDQDWLGAAMYWSHYDSTTNKQLLQDAGLHILHAVEATEMEDGDPVTFLWVIAQKPWTT